MLKKYPTGFKVCSKSSVDIYPEEEYSLIRINS